MDGHGNAMLVAGSIYEACKFYELFAKTELNGKCAIVTSYSPSVADTKGETTGEGITDKLLKYAVYLQKIANLAKASQTPGGPKSYPVSIQSPAQRALYNNLGKNEALAVAVDAAVLGSLQDDWRNNTGKTKRVRNAIRFVLSTAVPPSQGLTAQESGDASAPGLDLEKETDRILDLVKHQGGY